MPSISSLKARQILDSRGTPTIEVDVTLDDGSMGRAAVPSGASTGAYEAVELRDGDKAHYEGKSISQAVTNVHDMLLPALKGISADQVSVDTAMIELDGTSNKGKIGANAILGVSMGLSKALAISQKRPLWEYFRSLSTTAPSNWVMPVPMMNLLNGGKHASKSADFQEFMVMPVGGSSFSHAMEIGATIFMKLKKILHDEGHSTTVGDEGGFAPSLGSNQAALDLLVRAVEKSGYSLGSEVMIAMDVAASELFENGSYNLASESRVLSGSELVELYAEWVSKYPIISIEDGFDQDAWKNYQDLTAKIGNKVQIVGDDLFVTNVERLQQGIDQKAGNAILIKLNQIGTVTETVSSIDLARNNGFNAIVSHRSGETEDTTIADFVVGLGTGQIKTGSISRSDRLAKYNQLLRIEEALGTAATYPGLSAIKK
ncbi:MAG: phosphopyruvate hydratase [bacterium]|nr:phosphopyruvate hydratase [bacterium]